MADRRATVQHPASKGPYQSGKDSLSMLHVSYSTQTCLYSASMITIYYQMDLWAAVALQEAWNITWGHDEESRVSNTDPYWEALAHINRYNPLFGWMFVRITLRNCGKFLTPQCRSSCQPVEVTVALFHILKCDLLYVLEQRNSISAVTDDKLFYQWTLLFIQYHHYEILESDSPWCPWGAPALREPYSRCYM